MSKKNDFNKSIKELSIGDLEARIHEEEVRLKKMTFAHAITPLENPMAIRSIRSDLARLKTEFNNRTENA